MSVSRLSRRMLLRSLLMGSASLALAACQPKVVEKIVKETVEVEKTVKETVVVKEVSQVEKEVTRVVEKQVKAPAEAITLTVQHVHGTYEKFCKEVLDPKFEEMHGITIKREFTAGYVKEYYPKLMTMQVAGTPWDVAELPSWAGAEFELFLKGLFQALTPYMEKDTINLEETYWAGAVRACTFRGLATFNLPILLQAGQNVLAYNMDILNEVGIPEPTPDWRFDREFREALATLHDNLGDGRWTWAPSVESTWGYYDGLDAWNTSLLDSDGRNLLLDAEKGKDFLKFFYDLYQSGAVPRSGMLPGGAVQLFVAGQIAFLTTSIVGGPWRLDAVKASEKPFDARITLMPKGPEPDGRNGGTLDPHYVVMGSNAVHRDMAWEYMKYFVGPEMAGPLWDIGLFPARKDIWQNPEYVGRRPLYAVVREMFDRINFQSVPWNFHGNELDDTLLAGMMNVWLDKVGFDEGLAQTCADIREVLAKPMA